MQQIYYINSMIDDLLISLDSTIWTSSETIQNIYIYKDSNYN